MISGFQLATLTGLLFPDNLLGKRQAFCMDMVHSITHHLPLCSVYYRTEIIANFVDNIEINLKN